MISAGNWTYSSAMNRPSEYVVLLWSLDQETYQQTCDQWFFNTFRKFMSHHFRQNLSFGCDSGWGDYMISVIFSMKKVFSKERYFIISSKLVMPPTSLHCIFFTLALSRDSDINILEIWGWKSVFSFKNKSLSHRERKCIKFLSFFNFVMWISHSALSDQ